MYTTSMKLRFDYFVVLQIEKNNGEQIFRNTGKAKFCHRS